ncbi:MAG: hypothetical protein PHR00_01355 [Patescibacteria group bacterium]|nr:hypothetical protein [Patescibacteria group bacterium]
MKRLAFSLIEIIIVTFVITTAFMGLMGLIRNAITVTASNRNSFLAVSAAQEAVELTRLIRDQNWMMRSQQPQLAAAFYFGNNLVPPEFDVVIKDRAITGCRMISTIDYRVKDPANRSVIKTLYYVKTKRNSTERLILRNFGVSNSGLMADYIKDKRFQLYLCKDTNGQEHYQQDPDWTEPPANCQTTIFHRLVENTFNDGGTFDDDIDDYISTKVMVFWSDRNGDHYYVLNNILSNYSWAYNNAVE